MISFICWFVKCVGKKADKRAVNSSAECEEVESSVTKKHSNFLTSNSTHQTIAIN